MEKQFDEYAKRRLQSDPRLLKEFLNELHPSARVVIARDLQKEGKSLSFTQFNYINPLPKNTRDILSKYKKILVCELNLGQFAGYLRNQFPEFQYEQFNKIQGLPFTVSELKERIRKMF